MADRFLLLSVDSVPGAGGLGRWGVSCPIAPAPIGVAGVGDRPGSGSPTPATAPISVDGVGDRSGFMSMA